MNMVKRCLGVISVLATVCAPVSMRACAFAAASSILSFGRPASMALVMPPSASISSICAHAFFASS